LAQIKDVPWDDWSIAVPAFLAITLMAFTYSITVGIGAAVIAFVMVRSAVGEFREVSPLLWIVGALFVAYFALNLIQQALNVK
jgi:AGZA family xanthine/uracil permease-like MFS transporter